jgi:hypothetical protein
MALLLNLSEINMNYMPDKVFLLGCSFVIIIFVLQSCGVLDSFK